MTPRDRTIPIVQPAFAEPAHPRNPNTFRVFVDASVLLTIVGLIFGGGVAWKTFLDDGKRLDTHDTEIQQLTQIAQQQQVTLSALSQNVADIKDRLPPPEGR